METTIKRKRIVQPAFHQRVKENTDRRLTQTNDNIKKLSHEFVVAWQMPNK